MSLRKRSRDLKVLPWLEEAGANPAPRLMLQADEQLGVAERMDVCSFGGLAGGGDLSRMQPPFQREAISSAVGES